MSVYPGATGAGGYSPATTMTSPQGAPSGGLGAYNPASTTGGNNVYMAVPHMGYAAPGVGASGYGYGGYGGEGAGGSNGAAVAAAQQEVARLEAAKAQAVASEDYELAGQVKDEITAGEDHLCVF